MEFNMSYGLNIIKHYGMTILRTEQHTAYQLAYINFPSNLGNNGVASQSIIGDTTTYQLYTETATGFAMIPIVTKTSTGEAPIVSITGTSVAITNKGASATILIVGA